MTKPESCRIVYKEASGFQLEPEEQSEHKQYNHAVATPTILQNPECRALNSSSLTRGLSRRPDLYSLSLQYLSCYKYSTALHLKLLVVKYLLKHKVLANADLASFSKVGSLKGIQGFEFSA